MTKGKKEVRGRVSLIIEDVIEYTGGPDNKGIRRTEATADMDGEVFYRESIPIFFRDEEFNDRPDIPIREFWPGLYKKGLAVSRGKLAWKEAPLPEKIGTADKSIDNG